MRLTTEQVEIIKEEVARVFGNDVKVRLFGSRVDDHARGGDIDLLVASDTPIQEHRRKALRQVARLQMRLGDQPIDVDWVRGLEQAPELAERLEAFTSRYGRMQDTIAEKLLPRWLHALAERAGSQIETLNRAERLGVIASVERWLEGRKLRNRLVHAYMEDPAGRPCARR